MTKKLMMILLAGALTLAAAGKKTAKKGGAVKDAEKAWAEATIKGDEAALAKILHDDLAYTHSNADTDTKKAFIDNLKNGVRKYSKIDYETMDVHSYGKATVLIATAKLDVTTRGQQAPAHLKFIHVWVLSKTGEWQLAAHQSTRIP